MPYPSHVHATPEAGLHTPPGEAATDALAPRYGVVVRDIFSDGGWSQVEPVRARDWHDTVAGDAPHSSETSFD